MATPQLAESNGNQVDRWPTSTIPTVMSFVSLFLLMHPWKTRWGD